MSHIKYPHVHVKLSGTDGNVFSIIGKVSNAIKRGVGAKEAKEYQTAAMNCDSYDAVLVLTMGTVDVS